MIKKTLLILCSLLVVLVLVLLFRTLSFKSIQPAFAPTKPITVSDSAVADFQQGLRFKTVSYGNLPPDSLVFTQFHQFLQKTYPLFFSKLSKTVVAKYALVFKWTGKDTTLKPILLMAHQDVVPVEKEVLSQWKVDPFSGSIVDGKIWGRGTADDKFSLFAILEATEQLLKEGYQPAQTVYFEFGHDEEKGGTGAKAADAYLMAKGVRPQWVLDEGGEMTRKEVPGFSNRPIALIGMAEKGYASVQLSVDITGGHSSMPKAETAIDVLIKAVENVRAHPFKAAFTPVTDGTFNYLGPEMPFGQKIIFANRWLFDGLLLNLYQSSPSGGALVHTTIAPTIIQAGLKDNVIPSNAIAVVNLRILSGNTITGVLNHLKESVNDKRVKISLLNGMYSEASHNSSDTSAGFKKVAATIRGYYPNSIVAPFLCVAATDSRKFENISSCVLRFSPITDMEGIHGINEHVGVEAFKKGVNFYYQVLKN